MPGILTYSMRTSPLGRLSRLSTLAASSTCWSEGWLRWPRGNVNGTTADGLRTLRCNPEPEREKALAVRGADGGRKRTSPSASNRAVVSRMEARRGWPGFCSVEFRQGQLSAVVVIVLAGVAVHVGQRHEVSEVRVPASREVHSVAKGNGAVANE